MAHAPIEMLTEAFSGFKEASDRLQKRYELLEKKVEELNAELAEKNMAMERSRRLSAMGEMAARIAHEIRNPLGSMGIFAEILEREPSVGDVGKELAARITRGIRTLDNILANMLLFAASPGASLQRTDLKDVISDAISLAGVRMNGGVTVDVSHAGPTVIQADPGQMRQLFMNLLLNAAHATGDSGLICVATRLDAGGDNRMEIEVRDDGRGIPPDDLDRIFDPFFTTGSTGTGLGLAIVSSVVAAHRGRIDVSSRVGQGTSFVIKLPVGVNE